MKKRKSIRELVVAICITLIVLSTATYAWFEKNNKVDVYNLSIIAGGMGILEIADDTGNGPGEYADELNLSTARGGDKMESMVLNPVTTKDGATFYSPIYEGNSVINVKQIVDKEKLNTQYVYEKTFYLKAGPNPNKDGKSIVVTENKMYDIFLVGPAIGLEHKGTHVYQSPDVQNSSVGNDSAANAIRISFELEDGTVIIYEPNADVSNQDTNRAEDHVKKDYGNYTTIMQSKDGVFINSENGQDSPVLFKIAEGKDVKVTMRVWIEGTDLDCTDSITMDTVMAMFEFMSREAVDE